MARPRLIRTKDGGEITLKNASAETVAAVEAALEGKPESTQSALIENRTGDATLDGSPLTSVAVGMYQHPLSLDWHVVTLKFSPISKRGEVDVDMKVNRDKYEAVEKFKIQVVKSGLVGG